MLSKLKQFRDLRKQAKEMKDVLSQEVVTGEALWGKVKITMDGSQEVKEVYVDESLMQGKKEEIEKGVKEAFEKAVKEVRNILAKKMQSGDLKMPEF